MVQVIKICEGVVEEARSYSSPEQAEKAFVEMATQMGASSSDMEEHLEDGYYQIMNASVCLVHPEMVEGPQEHTELLAKLLDASKAHGENSSEPDHEVGDLQQILASCWAEMSKEQRLKVYEQHKNIVEENLN